MRYPARIPARPKKVDEKPGVLLSSPKISGEIAPPILPPAEATPSAVALKFSFRNYFRLEIIF